MLDQPLRQHLDSVLPRSGRAKGIRLGEPARLEDLHDYFARLGAEATLNPDGTLDVLLGKNGGPDGRPQFEVMPRAGDGQPLRVGDLLVNKGMITDEQLSKALVESRETGELVGLVLLRRGWVFESELARTLAEQWRIPYLDLAALGVDEQAVRLLPYDVGVRYAAVPVRHTDRGVQVAFADPSDQALDAIRQYLGAIEPAVAELQDITTIWHRVAGT
jgi:hypothetical protein